MVLKITPLSTVTGVKTSKLMVEAYWPKIVRSNLYFSKNFFFLKGTHLSLQFVPLINLPNQQLLYNFCLSIFPSSPLLQVLSIKSLAFIFCMYLKQFHIRHYLASCHTVPDPESVVPSYFQSRCTIISYSTQSQFKDLVPCIKNL